MHALERRPAVRCVLLLSAGILLAQFATLETTVVFWTTLFLFLCTSAFVFFSIEKNITDFSFALLVVALGGMLHTMRREEANKLFSEREDETVVFSGVVDDIPFIRGARFQLVVEVGALARSGTIQHEQRRILVQGRTALLGTLQDSLVVGSTVVIVGTLDGYPQPRNPGDGDYGRYLELNDIQGIVSLHNNSKIIMTGTVGAPRFFSLVHQVRSSLLKVVERLHAPNEASFLRGILLGDRSKIPDDVKQAFVDTGTVHVLAVSGLHVGIVALVFYGFFGLLRLPRRVVAAATIVGLFGYMVLIDSPPSVVRATIMATMLLLGPIFERKVDVYQSLAVAALILLVWDSNNLFHVGFQLSFAAVLSIVSLYPVFVNIVHRIPERFEELKLIDPVLKLFAVSLAAQLGTLPFTAYYFDRISLVSLLANLLVVPIVGVNVMIGFATLGFWWIAPWIAYCYATLNEWLVAFLLGFVKAASTVPYAALETSNFSLHAAIPYYVALVGLVNVGNRNIRNRCLILLLAMVTIIVYSRWVFASDAVVKVTMLDVGQGDAIFVECPSGATMLVDAGPQSPGFDAGERIVVPFLKHAGVNNIDVLVMSHPHSDHIGGVPAVLRSMAVRRLIEPAVRGETDLYRRILNEAQERSIPITRLGAGDTINIDQNVRLYVLHPRAPQDSTGNLNNVSLVVKLVYGSNGLLLLGDAEREVEATLIRRFSPMLRADVLKVAHHGSSTSSTFELLNAVRPSVALVSVGRKNKFHHPSSAVLDRFHQMGIVVYRTDRAGAIVLQSTGETFALVDWRQ